MQINKRLTQYDILDLKSVHIRKAVQMWTVDQNQALPIVLNRIHTPEV